MYHHSQEARKQRSPRWTTRSVLQTGVLLAFSVLPIGTGAEELTLLAPPASQFFKRALPVLSQYLVVQADRADFAFVKDSAWKAVEVKYPDDYTHTASLVRAAGLDPNTYRFSR